MCISPQCICIYLDVSERRKKLDGVFNDFPSWTVELERFTAPLPRRKEGGGFGLRSVLGNKLEIYVLVVLIHQMQTEGAMQSIP